MTYHFRTNGIVSLQRCHACSNCRFIKLRSIHKVSQNAIFPNLDLVCKMILQGTYCKCKWVESLGVSASLKLLWLQCRRCSGNCVFSFRALFFQQRLFEPLGVSSLNPQEFEFQTCLFVFFATLCEFCSWARRSVSIDQIKIVGHCKIDLHF